MNIKRTIAALLSFSVMMLSSCTEADITVKGGQGSAENKFPKEENKFVLTVNVSSGTFHLDENCRYVKNIKEENMILLNAKDLNKSFGDFTLLNNISFNN